MRGERGEGEREEEGAGDAGVGDEEGKHEKDGSLLLSSTSTWKDAAGPGLVGSNSSPAVSLLLMRRGGRMRETTHMTREARSPSCFMYTITHSDAIAPALHSLAAARPDAGSVMQVANSVCIRKEVLVRIGPFNCTVRRVWRSS